jgi:phosphonate transport system ATP-binding protein
MIYTLDGVTKVYSARAGAVKALNGVNLNVSTGECVALIGQSGVGKSTLFRLLNATQRPTAGSLRFDGAVVSEMSSRELRSMRRRVGTVYQQHYLVPSLSVLDNALCGRLGSWSLLRTLRSAVRPPKDDVERAIEVLESVGLADKRRARADELSGGQQQRLAIARALIQQPDVILADEPVASLDPTLAESITNLLVRLVTEGKRTLIVSLHSVELARCHFPRIVGLRRGAIAFDVPSTALTSGLLDEVFRPDGTQTKDNTQADASPRYQIRCSY